MRNRTFMIEPMHLQYIFSGLECSSKLCSLANQEERLADLHQDKRNEIVIQPDYGDLAEKEKRAPGMEFVRKGIGRIFQKVNFPGGTFGMEVMRQKISKDKV